MVSEREAEAPAARQAQTSLSRAGPPHLWGEVDAGAPVEEQLGHVEVLVVSCDVEGGESRLEHNRREQCVTSHATVICISESAQGLRKC